MMGLLATNFFENCIQFIIQNWNFLQIFKKEI